MDTTVIIMDTVLGMWQTELKFQPTGAMPILGLIMQD
jgi:hypothetical protein